MDVYRYFRFKDKLDGVIFIDIFKNDIWVKSNDPSITPEDMCDEERDVNDYLNGYDGEVIEITKEEAFLELL